MILSLVSVSEEELFASVKTSFLVGVTSAEFFLLSGTEKRLFSKGNILVKLHMK